MMSSRRKKWTESEERTLIDRYGEMVSHGTLAKMKTREKKFKPIACYVNSVHHLQDPIAYRWQWSWKDVSTKVQNMRHQYILVKQKIKKQQAECNSGGGGGGGGSGECSEEEFDWMEGLAHWSNFLRYKDIFGDVEIVSNRGNDLMVSVNGDGENGGGFVGSGRGMGLLEFGQLGHSDGDFGAGIDGVENGVMGLGFEYDVEEGRENFNSNDRLRQNGDDKFVCEGVEQSGHNLKKRKKKKREVSTGLGKKKAWAFLCNQLGKLKEMEARFEHGEAARERDRQGSENFRMECEQEREWKWEEWANKKETKGKTREKLKKQRILEWEALEKESEERERRRKEEELIHEREWEERMNRRRTEWKMRIDEMFGHHRAAMGQMQTRILHEQQNLMSQLLGIVSQWTAHPAGLSDHTNASNHYLSQMMQNLHHVNSLVHDDARVEGENQDDQFIVDG
ncbi:hypothetical protein D8674_010716 [Pyrus ussuriensis x Pyrus communis]|uniref:Uncharacterized protein n=1 Tax=Pyrus ussuriensis x Pyrus communis TaxID=2448454 RepID=A0A5N5FBJ4_9ROSA|nr:hypothetical protein D8674_010716 [Pyrus ussuriensis x Pyrus communis]